LSSPQPATARVVAAATAMPASRVLRRCADIGSTLLCFEWSTTGAVVLDHLSKPWLSIRSG
jgi:hypothetical protein